MLVRALYTSVVAAGVEAADIDRLVASARRRNRQLDLTGALLVCDGHFAQVLEGREGAVEEMLQKIGGDHRHHGMRVQTRLQTEKRMFANWDMAFVDASRCEAQLLELLAQRETPESFIAAMAGWMDEHRSAPL